MPFHHREPVWTDGQKAKLIAWRAEGLNNKEIGQRLGRSHKAVGAKVKAMNLPRGTYRSVPPGRKAKGKHLGPKTEPVQRAGKVTLPPLPSLMDAE